MKSILSLAVAAGILFASCGPTVRTTTTDNAAYNVTVPQGIRSSFAISYPDATNVVWNRYDAATVPIDWELTDWTVLDSDDYVVTFDIGSTRYHGYYDANGNLVGTAYTVSDYSKLPYAVNSFIQNNYKDYELDSVEKEMWKSQEAYEIKLKKGEEKIKILVDPSGRVLKQKTKS